jgi:hypothetical protein
MIEPWVAQMPCLRRIHHKATHYLTELQAHSLLCDPEKFMGFTVRNGIRDADLPAHAHLSISTRVGTKSSGGKAAQSQAAR